MQQITLQFNEFVALYTMASAGAVSIAVYVGQLIGAWLQRHGYIK